MSPPKMPVTIAPPPGAMAPWPVGVAADAHLHTPMKKSRSDEKLSDVDLEQARHQFHQMLSRERPELSKRDKGRIVRSRLMGGGSKNEKKKTVIPPTTKDPPALGPSPFNFTPSRACNVV